MMIPSTILRIRPRSATCAAGVFCTLAVATPSAMAQCTPEWTFFYPYSLSGTQALYVHDDDGQGPILPALYAGGPLQEIGPMPRDLVARFDGMSWSMAPGLGAKYPYYSHVVETFIGVGEEHPNPEMRGLWAAGRFDYEYKTAPPMYPTLARWDGSQWHFPPTTPNNTVLDLELFNDNNGGPDSLIAAGLFYDVGAQPIPSLARWDGSTWSEIPGGPFHSSGSFFTMQDLYVWDDDGSGPNPPELYVGGRFDRIASGLAVGMAKWDGNEWSSVGGHGPYGVRSMIAFDADGPGPEREYLYVGGGFTGIGGPVGDPNRVTYLGLARWDGTEWSAVPGWEAGSISTMAIVDFDGDGPNPPNLCVGGPMVRAGGQPAQDLARWDGKDWYPIMPGQVGIGGVRAMAAFDEDGPGPQPGGLYVGGDFWWMGGQVAAGLARWGCPIEQRCAADCDHSTGVGVLDIFDFLCFQSAFVMGNSAACDCDTSSGFLNCDIFDFLCFQNAFVVGCP